MRKAVTATKLVKIAKRRDDVLPLYFQGYSMREIAAKVGCSLGTVSGDIAAALKTHGTETREALRAQKAAEYARLKMKWQELAFSPPPDPEWGRNGIMTNYKETEMYLKILGLETKLHGLDEPPPRQMGESGTPTDNTLHVTVVSASRSETDDEDETGEVIDIATDESEAVA